MVSNGEAADPAAGQAVTASQEMVDWIAFREHRASCPDHPERVRGRGACTCGARDDAEVMVSAIKAEAQRELAAKVLPVLDDGMWGRRNYAAEFVAPEKLWCRHCDSTALDGHRDDCTLAALIESLRALVETGDGQ